MPNPTQPQTNMAIPSKSSPPTRRTTTKPTPSHGLTQKKVLDALGAPTMTWSYMWGLRSVRDIYNTFWAWDTRVQAKGCVMRGIWKSESYVLAHLKDPRVEFAVHEEDGMYFPYFVVPPLFC